jgi:RNA polymerase sigma-70 factor, ECF subfamily
MSMPLYIAPETLSGALAGDEHAVAELAALVRPAIERQLNRYHLQPEDREDLVQATLLQMLKHLPSFRGDANFSTWLFRVTANEALMLLRSRKRLRARVADCNEFEQVAERQSSDVDLDEDEDTKQRETLVRSVLSELPDEYRDVVVAHYHLDLGLHEIASRLTLTESAVRSRLHRARARLRTLLESSQIAA